MARIYICRMIAKFFETLSNNYLEIFDDNDDDDDFNVMINVGEPLNSKIYKAHSVVLKYRSSYFRNELANANTDDNNVKTINLKHISVQQFEIIIKYIYGGIISIEQHDASFIFELMLIASEFLLEELVKYLETHLIESKAHWLRLQFSRIYHKSFQNDKLQKLQEWCNNIAAKYPDKVFESSDFTILQENALVSLISRDDLQMKEVNIWNHVIKWGIAQNPGLPSDSKTWSHENFLTLKITLQNCLPLIRYFQMSADDIIDSVRTYQQILEKDLWEDILTKFMSSNRPIKSVILPPRLILTQSLPSRSSGYFVTSAQTFSPFLPHKVAVPFSTQPLPPRSAYPTTAIQTFSPTFLPPKVTDPFSAIINKAQAAEIASWVDEKVNFYSATNNPYEFKLLLRGTRNGFTHETFWKLCNGQQNVIVVMKVKNSGEIFGGYNPIGWKRPTKKKRKSTTMKCDKSFIFSLKNDIQNSIFSRVKHPEAAISCRASSGPLFNKDLAMFGNFNKGTSCSCIMKSYEKPLKYENYTSTFSVDEYEIFQIKKINQGTK